MALRLVLVTNCADEDAPHPAESYIEQNARSSIDERRMLRAVLRSLEGQTVRWPYSTVRPAKKGLLAAVNARRPAPDIITYPSGVLEVQRQGSLPWKGLELGSGFDVRIKYGKDVFAGAAHLGLTDDFALSDRLAAFLERNADLIDDGLPAILAILDDYQSTLTYEARRKVETMSYGFLRDVFDKLPMTVKEMEYRLREGEANDRLQTLVADHPDAFRAVQERLHAIFRSRATCLWYLFWVGAFSSPSTFKVDTPTAILLRTTSGGGTTRRLRSCVRTGPPSRPPSQPRSLTDPVRGLSSSPSLASTSSGLRWASAASLTTASSTSFSSRSTSTSLTCVLAIL